MHVALWLSESGVLTKRDMQNMQSRGVRELGLGTAALAHVYEFKEFNLQHIDFSEKKTKKIQYLIKNKKIYISSK